MSAQRRVAIRTLDRRDLDRELCNMDKATPDRAGAEGPPSGAALSVEPAPVSPALAAAMQAALAKMRPFAERVDADAAAVVAAIRMRRTRKQARKRVDGR